MVITPLGLEGVPSIVHISEIIPQFSLSRRRESCHFSTTAYHSDLIYTATKDEDKEKLWNNKRLWNAVGALTGRDMVDKLIPYAGKKQAIVERIERLSGYDDEEDYEGTVKN